MHATPDRRFSCAVSEVRLGEVKVDARELAWVLMRGCHRASPTLTVSRAAQQFGFVLRPQHGRGRSHAI